MGRRTSWWAAWLVGGVAATGLYFAFPVGSVGLFLTYSAIAFSSVVATLIGVRRHRPAHPSVWWVLALSHAIAAVGNTVYGWYLLHDAVVFPSPADALFFLSYVPLAGAVLAMARIRTGGRDRGALLDSAIIATGFGLLLWTFLIRPAATATTGDTLARLTNAAYPVVDLLVLALLARLTISAGARTVSFRMLCAAMALGLFSDLSFAIASMVGATEVGYFTAGWLLSYVLYGAAALHPSVGSLTEPAQVRSAPLTRRRLVLLTAVSLLAPAVLAVQGLTGPDHIDWAGVTIGSVVLFLLVLSRMSGLVDQVRQQSERLTLLAHSDGLTGVPNRRAWDLRLEAILTERQDRAVHVALLDLDHFKRFNDTYGHQAGDRLLKEAAAAWTSRLRAGDLLARYGGEEFGLLVVGAGDEQTLALVNRLREATPGDQTFSAGVACRRPGEQPASLVARADAALYEAKRTGRDRAVLAGDPPPDRRMPEPADH
ncbi:GGDEF domain-containing protein [Actinoplanes sp. M2I2]|uniref:GGDEF domain-containing protein n=1 Tax=Actinoplanes sp. M2I2 TaxID=1734444 RepID=UPI00202118FF|nr:GGDEF domain-containing protein [Actinoplanes sp. M2I2]